MKKTLIASALLLLTASAFSYDWPVTLTGDDFEMYFGQLNGSSLNPSIIFKDEGEVKAADEGSTAIIMGSHNDDMGWFPSALGEAVILSHENSIDTVYANIELDTLSPSVRTDSTVASGKVIAKSGNTAWQSKHNGLEFQVADVKNKAMINPRILMPRLAQEAPYFIGTVTVTDRNGSSYNLSQVKALYSGQYSFYREKDALNVPYRATITVNGEVVHRLQYDSLSTAGRRLCVGGSPELTAESVYPDSKRQLLGTINLVRGRNLIIVTMMNILGETRTASWAIDVI